MRLELFVTNLGDSAVTVPLAVLTCCFLGAAGEMRLALGYAASIAGCAGLIAVLKLSLAACGLGAGLLGIASPSGHAALSAAVYGSLSLLIGSRSPSAIRPLVYLAGALLVAAIGTSRLLLGAHAVPEVAAGLIVGLGAVAAFHAVLSLRPAATLPLLWLLAPALVLIGLLHGMRWPAEQAIRRLSGLLRLLALWCS